MDFHDALPSAVITSTRPVLNAQGFPDSGGEAAQHVERACGCRVTRWFGPVREACARADCRCVCHDVEALAAEARTRTRRDAAARVAVAFHEAYETLAPEFGYHTRIASAVPWSQVPEANRALMVATVERLLAQGVVMLPAG